MPNNNKTCDKCGDKLTGHEDDSSTTCRWCVTGWVPDDKPGGYSKAFERKIREREIKAKRDK